MNLDNMRGYLNARATAILVGSAIMKRDLIEASDWPAITRLAREFVEKVREFKAGK